MPNFYRNRRVLVTGGTGFVGRNLVQRLVNLKARVRVATLHGGGKVGKAVECVCADLRVLDQCLRAARGVDTVFHLAAYGYGFHANVNVQPELLTDNVLMNTCMLEAAHRKKVPYYLFTSSIAVYDRSLRLLDDDAGGAFCGEPHESEQCYAWAKRMGEIQCRAYREHYGMNIAIVRLSNPYGPWDTFDVEKSHVVPAFILKAFSNGQKLMVRGTGRPVRNFTYVDDIVDGMLLVLEKYAVADPLNLCSDDNVSIADLAKIVLQKTNRQDKKITYSSQEPEGVLERIPLTEKIKTKIGFQAKTPLEKGIENTIKWWKEHALER